MPSFLPIELRLSLRACKCINAATFNFTGLSFGKQISMPSELPSAGDEYFIDTTIRRLTTTNGTMNPLMVLSNPSLMSRPQVNKRIRFNVLYMITCYCDREGNDISATAIRMFRHPLSPQPLLQNPPNTSIQDDVYNRFT